MSVTELATDMISTVRAQGEVPVYVAVSPDLYGLWQQENGGVEPTAVLGLPIRIRDNYKQGTMLILGDQVEKPVPSGLTLDTVMEKIERGDYGPDVEAATLVRMALRENDASEHTNNRIMGEFYNSLERGGERFANDALNAVRLGSHPRAAEIYRFAEKMAGDEADETKRLAVLRRIAGFIHSGLSD